MQTVTRIDDATGETLMWCGGADFDIIQAQKNLNNAGYTLLEIREDQWAVMGRRENPEGKEADDGRQGQ